jgi:DNA mismatch endonuclease (patch repair protein)
MQLVRQKHTEPERMVRKLLFSSGYRYRLHVHTLPGSPDIVLPRHKKIVFVNGCFWHGHENCKRAKLPANNSQTWRTKIERTRERDSRNRTDLANLGWSVLTIWECQLGDERALEQRIDQFMRFGIDNRQSR